MRLLWLIMGTASLGLGGAGIVVPLLPATPLVILAAFCFARSSPALHDRLLASRAFGKAIEDWRTRRAISCGGKAASVTVMAMSLLPTVAFGAGTGVLAVQALVLCAAAGFVLRCNTADRCGGRSACAPPSTSPGLTRGTMPEPPPPFRRGRGCLHRWRASGPVRHGSPALRFAPAGEDEGEVLVSLPSCDRWVRIRDVWLTARKLGRLRSKVSLKGTRKE